MNSNLLRSFSQMIEDTWHQDPYIDPPQMIVGWMVAASYMIRALKWEGDDNWAVLF